MGYKRCPKCGATGQPDWLTRCDICHARFPKEIQTTNSVAEHRRSRWVALLCAWASCFGLYELYMGDKAAAKARMQYSTKAVLLCMFVVGIPMFFKVVYWTFRDMAVVIFSRDLRDYNGNPVTWKK